MSDITASAAPVVRLAWRVPSSWPARRILQICLATAWLLDAALQFQPYMFSRAFVTQVIEPTAAGNPAVVSVPVLWSAHLMAEHLVLYNTLFALIQLAIAMGLLFRRTTTPALAASIAWAASVWWFGEGLGGILAGASPLTGAPGAVILYALIALLLWPTRNPPDSAQVAPALRGPLGATIPRLAWLALWCGFACYLLLPANRAPKAIGQVFAGMATGQAGWVKHIEGNLATVTAGHGLAVSLLLAVLCAVTGLAIFADRLTRPVLVFACLLGLLFWVAEGFGGLTTGHATDPNSGPLLILLAACFWPWTGRRPPVRPGSSCPPAA